MSKHAIDFSEYYAAALNTAPALRAAREAYFERFLASSWPDRRHEHWKYLNLSHLQQTDWPTIHPLALEQELPALQESAITAYRLVFHNGVLQSEYSDLALLSQYISIITLEQQDPEHYGPPSWVQHQPFALLSAAIAQHGMHLDIPAGTMLERPIHCIFYQSYASPSQQHVQNRLSLGADSAITFIETHVGQGCYFHNHHTTFELGRGSHLKHLKKQQESLEAFHIASHSLEAAASSRYERYSASYGGQLSRQDFEVALSEPHISINLHGLNHATGQQQMDEALHIQHQGDHSETQVNFRSIATEQSVSNFLGSVVIQPETHQNSAHVMNKNLILQPTATVNTRPILQIDADDVVCSHGATTGDLDPDALYYLRTRGIDEASAQHMLLNAFAHSVFTELDSVWQHYLHPQEDVAP